MRMILNKADVVTILAKQLEKSFPNYTFTVDLDKVKIDTIEFTIEDKQIVTNFSKCYS